MTGYRTSGFDPNYAPQHELIRPFDRWQWLGVALTIAGALLMIVDLFDLFGGYDPEQEGTLILGGLALLWWRDPHLPAGTLGNRRRIVLLVLAAIAVLSATVAYFDL